MGYSVKSIRKQFAEKGVFYTDERLAKMLADIMNESGQVTEIYDPTCGDGNLLAVFPNDVAKYGQEIDPAQAENARQRLSNAVIAVGDTLVRPAFTEKKFRHIVANPPFSVKWKPKPDPRWIDAPTLPPPGKADYAFLLHILHMLADDGVAAVLNFPGVLYRGNREKTLREWVVRQNVIESVTHIEGGYFEDTKIPTALIVFRKGRTTETVKFIDHEKGLEAEATLEDIAKNDYNLSPSNYIRYPEERKEVDLYALEMQARESLLIHLDKALGSSKAFEEMHKMFGLGDFPKVSNFVSDLGKILDKYR